MIPIGGGFQVPERFTTSPPLVHRARRARCQVAVEMVGGKPRIRGLAIESTGPRPLTAADLAAMDWAALLDAAVQQEARKYTPPLEWAGGKDPTDLAAFTGGMLNQLDQQSTETLAAARSARHPRRFPAADLARLLTIHADKGIEGVKAEFSVSERQAYRLLDRARKEIP